MTIMGCISSAGTIDISKRNPGVYKKILGASKAIRAWKGTNTDHILIFLKNMLDKEGMKEHYVVMGQCKDSWQ